MASVPPCGSWSTEWLHSVGQTVAGQTAVSEGDGLRVRGVLHMITGGSVSDREETPVTAGARVQSRDLAKA
jgi:hypothetical protein